MNSTAVDEKFGMGFLSACETERITQINEAIASGRQGRSFLDEGLVRATGKGIKPGYKDIIIALLAAGACITPWSLNALHGEDLEQDPAVVRLYFDHGLDPNATQTGGEPILGYVYLITGSVGPPAKLSLSALCWSPLALANSSYEGLIPMLLVHKRKPPFIGPYAVAEWSWQICWLTMERR